MDAEFIFFVMDERTQASFQIGKKWKDGGIEWC